MCPTMAIIQIKLLYNEAIWKRRGEAAQCQEGDIRICSVDKVVEGEEKVLNRFMG